MRAGTRHGLYQSCVRGDSVGVAAIEVARANALAIARRGGTRQEAATGDCVSRRGWVGTRWAGFCLVAVILMATQATPAGAKTNADAKISPPLLALVAANPK